MSELAQSSKKKPAESTKQGEPKEKHIEEGIPEAISSQLCIWHHRNLTLYCEIREELLCEECLNAQYKNNQTKIISVDEAYRYRIASIYNTLSTHLFGRKEQLEAQSRRIEFRLDELKRLKFLIERDMQSEFGGIYERLGSAFNTHGSLIQTDLKSLALDIESLDSIIKELNESDLNIVSFLMNYKNIKYSLENSISKPFRTDIKVKPTDLPRELEEIRALSSKCLSLQALVQFKNEMIWQFLHDRVPGTAVSSEIQKELTGWAELTDKFSKELEKYLLICDFCGILIDNENVNLSCPKNSSYSLSFDTSKYPAGFKGNTRHYFKKITPPVKVLDKTLSKYGDVKDKTLQKISKQARSKNIDAEKCFKQYDTLNNGYIAPTDFYYIMLEIFELTGKEITELILKYDKSKDGRIRYPEIIKEITIKLPEPYEKLRINSDKLLELCKKKDRLTEGAIYLEGFKDVLRQLGLSAEEVDQVAQNAAKNDKGKVMYSEFHDKFI
jgi:Ca2+-binding EF-hand superfamily protein